MKRQLLVSIVVVLLLLNILPLLSVKAATESANWSKPRPTTWRPFNNSLASAAVSSDGQTAVSLGVQVVEYDPQGDGIPPDLSLFLNMGATTRAGIDYEWNTPPGGFSWVNVSQPVGISGDDSYVLFNLGFTVLYYGINYSSLYVFSNGFVSFTSPSFASMSPSSLPNSSMPDAIVAPFWRELKLGQGGSIKTGYLIESWPGDYSTCYQVFTWDSIPDENGNPQTFQLLIENRMVGPYCLSYQSKIYFQYLSITDDVATTIGMQDRIGTHGNSVSLREISNRSAGGFNAIAYGIGYRLERLEFTITKQGDSNAMLAPISTLEDGANVEENMTGQNNYGPLWGTLIEVGAQQALDLIPGIGEVADGLFILYDITGALAGAQYVPASGTITTAGTGNDQSTGYVDCHDLNGGLDGSYVGLPFDASFGDGFLWQFLDNYSQNHTITVKGTAVYADNHGDGGQVSTSVVLNMYTGRHYLDIGSNVGGQTVSAPVTGIPVWVDGQQYSTPVSGLIVTQGVHNITVASMVYANGSPRYSFSEWSRGEHSNSLPAEDIGADWNENANYVIVGDINLDGIVNILDAILLGNAFGSKPGDKNWNSTADLNNDGRVDILDAIILGNNFMISYKSSYSGSSSGASGQKQPARPMTQGGPSILVDPSQVTVFKGENLTANVEVTGVTDLYGWEFQLCWNNTILNCTNAVVQTPTQWQNDTQKYGPGLEENYNATNALYWIGQSATNPAPSFNGSMTIATLTFQALQPGTTSLALMDTVLGDSTAQPINCTVSSGTVTVYSGRYMQSDTQTINGLGAYILNVPESTSSASVQQGGIGSGYSWGIRAFIRHSNWAEQEISLNGQTGTPKAVVSGGNGLQSATVLVAQTGLQQTDSLVIRVYAAVGTSGWTLETTFTTEQLQATTLQAATWTVYYYITGTYNHHLNISASRFYWGTTTYESRIQNLLCT